MISKFCGSLAKLAAAYAGRDRKLTKKLRELKLMCVGRMRLRALMH